MERPEHKRFYINTLPPMGLLSIASYLEKRHISADIVDYNVEDVNMDFKEYQFIGFSVYLSNIERSLRRIKSAKKINPCAKIIIGGPSCIANPEHFMQNKDIDAICFCEGEEALYEYIVSKDKTGIKGFLIKDSDVWMNTGERDWIKNLDALPFPSLNKVRLNKYDLSIRKTKPISSIITSRGCPYSCIFCFHSLGKQWRACSSERVVEEIEWQVNRFGVKELCIYDDNFTLDVNRAKDICDLIIKKKIKVKFQLRNAIRADKIDYDLCEKMHKAGVWLLGVSPETGSERTLKNIRKEINLDDVTKVVRQCKEIGLATFSCFMIGFPFETLKDVQDTIRYAVNLNTDIMQCSRVVPFPHTELFKYTKPVHEINIEIEKDKGLFYGIYGEVEYKKSILTQSDFKKLIKELYRKYYLKPSRIFKLIRLLQPNLLARLFLYSVSTGNL
ncbi:MAG: radical SAM protein [Candidatus Omnitrophica bacterium]|nr:radical SAM protein [Candidatus Omnitrophota bacterium]